MIDRPPLFALAACWCARMEVAVDHLDVTVMGGGDGVHHSIAHLCLAPTQKAIVAGGPEP